MSVSQPIKSYQMEIKPISFKASLSLNKVIFNPIKCLRVLSQYDLAHSRLKLRNFPEKS